MAATPGKAAAVLEPWADSSVVLIAGGLVELGGLAVHASPEERAVLDAACTEAARAARAVILFGPAAARIEPLLAGVDIERAGSLDEALEFARRRSSGAAAVVVAPMFPAAVEERLQVCGWAQTLA
jgi:hypothetical protein